MNSVVSTRFVVLAASCVLLGSACSNRADDQELAGSATEDLDEVDGLELRVGLPQELGVKLEETVPCPGSLLDPPGDFERVLDVVALPTSPTHANALQTNARVGEDGSVYHFAKTGLWWRGDAAFEIVVPDELRSILAIGWGGPAELAHKVRVDCGLSGSWMVMAGGYWVREPMCAAIVVRVGDVDKKVEIGLGKACAGQDPPAGPSDG